MDIHPYSLVEIESYILYVATTTTAERVGLAVGRLLESDSTVLQACVLGLPLQVWKFDSESSVSRGY